jgi:hypothetical protein
MTRRRKPIETDFASRIVFNAIRFRLRAEVTARQVGGPAQPTPIVESGI